jgi:hypothetical protein
MAADALAYTKNETGTVLIDNVLCYQIILFRQIHRLAQISL